MYLVSLIVSPVLSSTTILPALDKFSFLGSVASIITLPSLIAAFKSIVSSFLSLSVSFSEVLSLSVDSSFLSTVSFESLTSVWVLSVVSSFLSEVEVFVLFTSVEVSFFSTTCCSAVEVVVFSTATFSLFAFWDSVWVLFSAGVAAGVCFSTESVLWVASVFWTGVSVSAVSSETVEFWGAVCSSKFSVGFCVSTTTCEIWSVDWEVSSVDFSSNSIPTPLFLFLVEAFTLGPVVPINVKPIKTEAAPVANLRIA